ncbi:hypothetical protein BHE74_00026718 [Ensete ventricosum]|nr:hypothetical protein BHE74_00026718 [Ensete ventricosum]
MIRSVSLQRCTRSHRTKRAVVFLKSRLWTTEAAVTKWKTHVLRRDRKLRCVSCPIFGSYARSQLEKDDSILDNPEQGSEDGDWDVVRYVYLSNYHTNSLFASSVICVAVEFTDGLPLVEGVTREYVSNHHTNQLLYHMTPYDPYREH